MALCVCKAVCRAAAVVSAADCAVDADGLPCPFPVLPVFLTAVQDAEGRYEEAVRQGLACLVRVHLLCLLFDRVEADELDVEVLVGQGVELVLDDVHVPTAELGEPVVCEYVGAALRVCQAFDV